MARSVEMVFISDIIWNQFYEDIILFQQTEFLFMIFLAFYIVCFCMLVVIFICESYLGSMPYFIYVYDCYIPIYFMILCRAKDVFSLSLYWFIMLT